MCEYVRKEWLHHKKEKSHLFYRKCLSYYWRSYCKWRLFGVIQSNYFSNGRIIFVFMLEIKVWIELNFFKVLIRIQLIYYWIVYKKLILFYCRWRIFLNISENLIFDVFCFCSGHPLWTHSSNELPICQLYCFESYHHFFNIHF
jgi:hypothetical protein